MAARKRVAQQATKHAAHDQAGRSVRTAAIIAAVITAIDAIITRQTALAIIAGMIVTCRIIVAVAGVGAIPVVMAAALPIGAMSFVPAFMAPIVVMAVRIG